MATRGIVSNILHCADEMEEDKGHTGICKTREHGRGETWNRVMYPRFGLPFFEELRVHGGPPPEYLEPPDVR